jgi:hypothetical protein
MNYKEFAKKMGFSGTVPAVPAPTKEGGENTGAVTEGDVEARREALKKLTVDELIKLAMEKEIFSEGFDKLKKPEIIERLLKADVPAPTTEGGGK